MLTKVDHCCRLFRLGRGSKMVSTSTMAKLRAEAASPSTTGSVSYCRYTSYPPKSRIWHLETFFHHFFAIVGSHMLAARRVDREDFVWQTHPSPAPNVYPFSSSSSPALDRAGPPPPLSVPFPCQSSRESPPKIPPLNLCLIPSPQPCRQRLKHGYERWRYKPHCLRNTISDSDHPPCELAVWETSASPPALSPKNAFLPPDPAHRHLH